MKRNFKKVNLNNYIKFIPNEQSLVKIRIYEMPDDDGYYCFQIWDFMKRFGEDMGCGMNCPINTNVLVEIENDKT